MIASAIKKRLAAVETAAHAQIAARPVPMDENRCYEMLAIIGNESLTVPEVARCLMERGYRMEQRPIVRVRELLNLARDRKAKGEPCKS